MFDLAPPKKKVEVISGADSEPSAGAILASLQDLEGYWETVVDDMPPVALAAIRNRPELMRSFQNARQAAQDYADMVRRMVGDGKLTEAARTLVVFQGATRSFHQTISRYEVRALGAWLVSEAVKDAFAAVEAVGQWLGNLPENIRNIGRGAMKLGKALMIGGGILAVILLAKK